MRSDSFRLKGPASRSARVEALAPAPGPALNLELSPGGVVEPATQGPASSRCIIDYCRNGLRIREQYFVEQAADDFQPCDLSRTLSVLQPAVPEQWRRSATLLIDLSKPEREILDSFGKNTRYKVHRALSKDSLRCSILNNCSPACLDEFCLYYDTFARAKGVGPVFRPRLASFSQNEMLYLSHVADETSAVLVWHAYVRAEARAMLLYSASNRLAVSDSTHRALIGRANRLLHWQDMRFFKQLGCACYDFGGIDVSGLDPEEQRIAEFKQGFGGQVVPIYGRTRPLTFKGQLAQWYCRVRGISSY